VCTCTESGGRGVVDTKNRRGATPRGRELATPPLVRARAAPARSAGAGEERERRRADARCTGDARWPPRARPTSAARPSKPAKCPRCGYRCTSTRRVLGHR
jgi:hypothetical protein